MLVSVNYLSILDATVALLTYSYATLRQYAAKKPDAYEGEEAILNDEPVTGKDIYKFVKDNIKTLNKEKGFTGKDGDFQLKQLQALLDYGPSESLKDSKVILFSDKNPRQLCYGIALNMVDKRIVVSFRGTNGLLDMMDDIRVAGADVQNPLYKETPNQKRQMQIHDGFYCKYPHYYTYTL
jgi:hypothetical protein